MSGLPKGWEHVSLGKLISGIETGKSVRCEERSPKPEERGIVKISAVTWGEFDVAEAKTAPAGLVLDEGTLIRSGDLLITRANTLELVGATVVVSADPGNLYLSDKVLRLRTEPDMAHWLNLYLRSSDGRVEIEARATGNQLSMRNIGQTAIQAIMVPLPPVGERRRIMGRVKELLTRTRQARAELERASVLLARQQRATLTAAFKGNLTENWRMCRAFSELPGHIELWPIPASWSWRKVSDLGKVSLGRQRTPKDHAGPHMRSYVRAANITWGGWKLSDVKQMNFDEAELERFRLKEGDVLLNEGSGSASEVGKPAIWQGQIKDCCFQNTLVRFQPKGCTSDYAYFYFLFSALTGAFAAETKGVNIHHIGKEGLANFSIPVPELDEQKEIAKRLRATLAGLDRIVAEQTRALALLDRLDTAILARAVRGELVLQDPSDEPAAALLARLAAAQPPASPKRRRAV